MLMMTDLARGLFRRAIPMSGTSFIKTWPFAARKGLTGRLAMALGWDGKNGERGILEVLENADAKELVTAESKLLSKEEIFVDHTAFPFTPVVEPYVNERTFLAKDPILLGRDAWSNDIDCMLGGTTLEGGMMFLWLDGVKLEEIFEDPANFTLPRELGLDITNAKDKQKASEYGTKLKKFYFGDNSPSPETLKEYLTVITLTSKSFYINETFLFQYAGDLHFWHGIYRAVMSRISSKGAGKTFFYHFDMNTSLNLMKLFLRKDYEGACHGDDMSYLFKSNLPGALAPAIDSKEFKLIRQMVSFVTSFAINGNPNCIENESEWEPIDSSEPLKCFSITNDSLEMITFPGIDRLNVWNEICKDSNVPLF